MTDSLRAGGTERQFSLLARGLRASRFELRLGCLQKVGIFLEDLEEITEFPLAGRFLNWEGCRAYFRLARYLQCSEVQAAQAFDFYSNLMLIPAARFARVPIVIASQRQLGDLLSANQRRVQDLMFRWADCVVCNSQAAARRIAESGIRTEKIRVIPNAIADESFADATPCLPRSAEMIRIGMIARMNEPAKNHALFLQAVASLVRSYPSVEIVLVGDGPLREQLAKLAGSLGLAKHTHFLGECRDMPAVLAAVDIVVVPSRSEGLSNVVLEAMAAARPVVASNVGGNPELVIPNKTGFLVPVDDAQALANAIATLIDSPELRARFGDEARRIARESYAAHLIRSSYEKLYLELLDRKHMRGRDVDAAPSSGRSVLPVAIVAPSLRFIGGQAVQADLLLRQWRGDSTVRAFLVPVDTPFPSGLKWIRRIPVLRTIARMPFYLGALWSASRVADVFHIFSASYWSFLLGPTPALAVAHFAGKKAIINYRSGEAPDHLAHWRSAVPILRRADRLVVPSRFLVDVFYRFGLQAEAVPNIVDLEHFPFRDRQPLRPLLLNTRTMERYYSVDVAVRAFAWLAKSLPEARFCVVGGGSLEPEIRTLIQELGLKKVDLVGPVSRSQIGAFYQANDIFLNASWLDNMPVSLIEAFSSGMPVVSTAPEGIRYLVENERTGLLCEPGDWRALAENTLRLLREPGLAARLVQNAREECRGYRWDAVRNRWLDIYFSVVGEPAILARRPAHDVPEVDGHVSDRN